MRKRKERFLWAPGTELPTLYSAFDFTFPTGSGTRKPLPVLHFRCSSFSSATSAIQGFFRTPEPTSSARGQNCERTLPSSDTSIHGHVNQTINQLVNNYKQIVSSAKTSIGTFVLTPNTPRHVLANVLRVTIASAHENERSLSLPPHLPVWSGRARAATSCGCSAGRRSRPRRRAPRLRPQPPRPPWTCSSAAA